METRLAPELGPDGRVATVLAVGRDITPLVEAERKAERNAKRLADLLGSISDGFFSLDEDFTITYFNPAAGRLLGRDPEEVVGRRLFEAFPEAKGSIFEEKYQQALQEGKTLEFEAYFEPDPYQNWYEVRVYPYERGISVYFRVVTGAKHAEEERKRLEERLKHSQKMEAVGTLAGGIAHDFNNLLAVVMGYAEHALEQKSAGSLPKNDLERIVNAAKRGSDLVQKILAFSRKRSGEFKAIELNQEVQAAAEILQRILPKMIDIKLGLSTEPLPVWGDSALLQQVILNLASNARDAMPDGGELSIATDAFTPDDDDLAAHPEFQARAYARLKVRDTGEGLSPELVEKVFDPFFTTKEVGSGTGLGLAMVYGIVKDHGGVITCDSDPAQGTSFVVYLPGNDEMPQASPRQEGDWQEAAGGEESVLVVDDEADLRELMTGTLEEKGYEVRPAASGEEALRLIEEGGPGPDLVILDIGMPGMGGWSALEKMSQLVPEAKVLVISGYAQDQGFKVMLKDKAAAYLGKPFSKARLLRTVRRVLDESRET
jgi:PAS domain S-box-containing protein